jgi:hypothetical protein
MTPNLTLARDLYSIVQPGHLYSHYCWVRSQGPGKVLAVKGADHGIAIVGLPTAVDITSAGKKARRAAKCMAGECVGVEK